MNTYAIQVLGSAYKSQIAQTLKSQKVQKFYFIRLCQIVSTPVADPGLNFGSGMGVKVQKVPKLAIKLA